MSKYAKVFGGRFEMRVLQLKNNPRLQTRSKQEESNAQKNLHLTLNVVSAALSGISTAAF